MNIQQHKHTNLKNKETKLLFLNDPNIKKILLEIIEIIPEENEIYLISGAVRNSIFYNFHSKKLPQRDFDAVIFGDTKKLIKKLKEIGFKQNPNEIIKNDGIILNKTKVKNPIERNFENYFYLDGIFSKEKTIEENLKKHANFTFNCSAINIKDILSKNRIEKTITVNNSKKHIQKLEIHLNSNDPTNIFSCLRFMSQGFKTPTKAIVEQMIKDLKEIPEDRYNRNIPKLFNYVGGEEEARKLKNKLGIKGNLFIYNEINNLQVI